MDRRTHYPQCKEIAVAAVIMAAFALGTILTADMFGHVTVDEVSYSDPAVNLVMNGTFTSSAWYSQTKDEFWASNTPLHQFILAGWLKTFGFSIYSVRGFSAFMVCAAGFGFWLFLRRAGFIATPFFGHLFLLAYGSGYGMSLWMRLGRPDATCLMIASLFCFAWNARKANALLFCLGAAAVWAGLHLAVWLAIVGLALAAVNFSGVLAKLLASGFGALVGTIMLAALYWQKGVLASFAEAVLPHTALGGLGLDAVRSLPQSALPAREFFGIASGDYSIWVLLPTFLILAGYAISGRQNTAWQISIWCTLVLLGTCFAFYYLGVTPQYYSWMLFIPLAISVFALASEAPLSSKPSARVALTGLVLLTLLVSSFGVFRRIMKVSAYGPLMSQSELKQKLDPMIGNAELVFVDSKAYYAVKIPGRIVMTTPYQFVISTNDQQACEAVVCPEGDMPSWVSARVENGSLEPAGSVVDELRQGAPSWLIRGAGTPIPNMQRVAFTILRKPQGDRKIP